MADIQDNPSDDEKTPAVVVIGDIIAQGLSQKLSEAETIISPSCSTGTIDNVLVHDAGVWPVIGNSPWFVVCVGTMDRRTDFYRLLNFRARLNRLPNTTGVNKHVIWILPMNNPSAANAVKLVARKNNDVVLNIPTAITTTTSIPYQVPVYTQVWVPPVYGWIWWPFTWGVTRAGYWQTVLAGYQTEYKVVTNQVWLSNNGKSPNDAGYVYLRDKLRDMTGDWGIKYDDE